MLLTGIPELCLKELASSGVVVLTASLFHELGEVIVQEEDQLPMLVLDPHLTALKEGYQVHHRLGYIDDEVAAQPHLQVVSQVLLQHNHLCLTGFILPCHDPIFHVSEVLIHSSFL